MQAFAVQPCVCSRYYWQHRGNPCTTAPLAPDSQHSAPASRHARARSLTPSQALPVLPLPTWGPRGGTAGLTRCHWPQALCWGSRVGKWSSAGKRASVARGLGSRPIPSLGPPSLALARRRNCPLWLSGAATRLPAGPWPPGDARPGRRQEPQGAGRPPQTPELQPGRDDRRGRSLAPEIPPGRCSGSEGPRSAHARRLEAAAPNFRQSFLPFLLEPAGDSGVMAVRPDREPRQRRSRGARIGVLAPGLVLQASPPRQREFSVPALLKGPATQRRQTGKIGARPAAPPPRTLRPPQTLPPGSCRCPGLPLRPACPRPRRKGPRLPENASPAAVSKSPAKVARPIPSLMLQSARRAAPPAAQGGRARAGGRSGSLGSRQREREPVSQSANSCTSPNSSGSQGRGRRSRSSGPAADPPTRRLALLQEGAEGASAEPKSALGSSGCCQAVLPLLRSEPPAVAVAVAARVPPAACPPAAPSPAPGRRRASSRARAGSARGACSRTDWRCPAGRLEGEPTSRPPGAAAGR